MFNFDRYKEILFKLDNKSLADENKMNIKRLDYYKEIVDNILNNSDFNSLESEKIEELVESIGVDTIKNIIINDLIEKRFFNN